MKQVSVHGKHHISCHLQLLNLVEIHLFFFFSFFFDILIFIIIIIINIWLSAKMSRHDITEILLKVALITINPTRKTSFKGDTSVTF